MADTKQDRDIRAQLKAIGQKTGRVMTSAAKLFLASGKEMFQSDMPTLVATYDTNKEVLDATIRFLRNPADSINRGVTRGMETETFQELKKLAKNAMDDLKSGNLYDPDRDRSEAGMAIDDMLKDFGGFDMSGFDENGDWTEPDVNGAELEGHAAIADVQEENASKRTVATIEAIGSSTEAITSTINANAQTNIRLSVKQHSQVMNALGNSVAVQTAQLKSMGDSMKAAMQVARESHTEVMGQLQTMTKLLEEIRDGVKPQKKTEEYRAPNDIFGASGELDIKAYIKQVVRNADERFGISSAATGMTAGMSAKQILELYQDNPWRIVSDLIMGQIVPENLRNQMRRTDTNIRNFFPALLDKLASNKGKTNKYGETSIVNELVSLLGVRQRSRTSIDTAIKDVNEQAVFTRRTATAIETVIPTLLAQINSNISGKPVMVYDYKDGKFKNAANVIADTYHKSHDLVGEMGTARDVISRGGQYGFTNSKDREEFQQYLYRFFQSRANDSNSGWINPFISKSDFMETMPESDKKELYYNLLMGLLQSMDRSDLMALSSEMFSSRRSRDRRNFSINRDLQENGMIAAFSGIFDENTMFDLETKSKKKQFGLSVSDVDKVLKDRQARDKLAGGGVQASNVLLTEILGTLKKGIITYSIHAGDATFEGGDALLQDVMKTATTQRDLESKILEAARRPADREKDMLSREMEDARKKAAQGVGPISETQITPGMDMSPELATQIMLDMRNRKGEAKGTDNPALQFINKQSEILSGKASEVLEQTGVMSIWDRVRKMTESPFAFMNEALKTVDAFMFKMLYGEDAALQLENGGEPSLMRTVIQAVKTQFLDAKDWFKANIGDPLKNTLFDKENGLFPRMGKAIKENLLDPLFQPVKDKFNETKNRIKKNLIGEKNEETGQYSGGKFSDQINRAKSAISPGGAIEGGIVNAFNRLLYGKYVEQKGKYYSGVYPHWNDDDGTEYLGAETEYSGIVGQFRRGFDSIKRFLFGEDFDADDETKAQNEYSRKRFKDVTSTLKEAAPGMAKGAGLGLLASFFLPGGPLVGSLLGAFGGLVGGTNSFSKYLLGDFAEETIVDPITGKTKIVKRRQGKEGGGLLSKEVADGLQRFVPGVTKGALIGSIAGGLGLLPFGLGGAAGTVIGAIGGMAATSDQIKKLIFGDGIDEKSGIITKEFREKIKKQVKNAAGPALGGAVLGGAAWSAISGLGLIPGLSLLPGGPIFALLGGITGAVNADAIKNFFFGEEADVDETVQEPDPKNPGKMITKTVHKHKRQGGMFGKIFDGVENKIIKPLGERMDKVGQDIHGWFQENIVDSLKNSMKPMRDRIQEATKSIGDSLKNIGQSILDGIGKAIGVSFNGEDGKGGLHAFIQDNIVKRLNSVVPRVFGGIGKAIGAVISSPFTLMEMIFSPDTYRAKRDKRRNERAESRRQSREERRQRRRSKRRARNAERQKARWTEIGGRFGTFFSHFFGGSEDDQSATDPEYYGIQQEQEESQAVKDYKARKQQEQEASTISDEAANKATRKAVERHLRNEKEKANKNANKQVKEALERAAKAEEKAKRLKDEKDKAAKAGNNDQSAEGKKRTGKKTNNEYLERIDKRLKSIYDEIKGQVNGVGWNTAYIKTLLEKQFGQTLSDEELPEEMEGSRKGIRKRRGILGKIKDKVTGVKDSIFDKLGAAKDRVLNFFEPVFRVIDFVRNIREGARNLGRKAWQGAKKVGGGLWKGAKAVGRGAKKAIGFGANLFLDVADIVRDGVSVAAAGLKNAVGALTGILKDGVLAVSGVVRGFIQTAAEIAPEIAAGVVDAIRAAGGLAWRGIKGGAKMLGKGVRAIGSKIGGGVKGLFNKIFHRGDKDKDGESSGDGSGNGLRSMKLDGGYLDEVKDSVHIKIGPKAKPVNYPYVSVMMGKAIGKKNNLAIPVYIVGADDAARLHVIPTTGGSPGGNTPTSEPASPIGSGSPGRVLENDTMTDSYRINTSGAHPVHGDNVSSQLRGANREARNQARQKKERFRRIKRMYRKVNKSTETAGAENAADVYDRAVNQAQDMDDIEAIKTVQQLNGGTQLALPAGSGGSGSQEDGGLLSGLFDMLGGNKGGFLKKALSFVNNWGLPIFALGYGLTQSGEKHVATRGLEGLTQTILKKSGLGSLTGSELVTGVKNIASDPTYLLRYSDEAAKVAADETVDAATRKAAKSGMKSLSRAFSVFDFIDMVRNPANAKAAMELGKEAGIRNGAGMWLKGAGASVINTIGSGIGKVGSAVKNAGSSALNAAKELATKVSSSRAGQAVKGAAEAVATKGADLVSTAKTQIAKHLDDFFKNPVVQKMLGSKLVKKVGTIKEKIIKILTGEALEKASKMAGKESIEQAIRTIGGLATAGIVTAGFAVADFITGWNEAYKMFGVHSTQVTTGMKATGAIYRALSGILSIIPVVGNVLSIALSFAEDPLVKAIYSIVGGEAEKEELEQNQASVAAKAEEAGMSASEYVTKYNADGSEFKHWYSPITDTLGAIGGGIKNVATGAWNGIKSVGSAIGNFFSGLFGGGPGYYGTGAVTPISQRDSKYNKFNNNMALAGCGPAAFSMVGSAYGKKLDPKAMSNAAYGMGMRAEDGGTNPAFFSKAAGIFGSGFGMREGPVNDSMIAGNIRNGQPVVMMGRGGPYGNHMHYLVADGVNGRGNVTYADPMTGSHKSTKMSSLTKNTKNAIYSYGTGKWGRGPDDTVEGADGTKMTTSEAQNALVNKMLSIYGSLDYSTSDPYQDPDRGVASCASTVGWAYRKVLGVNNMSAGSSTQSKDSRFSTIWVNNGNNPLDTSMLQPGDILYQNWDRTSYDGSLAKPMQHTEMYAGNGQDLSHGGDPKNGPVYKDLNEWRRKRTMMVRRYTPFTDPNAVVTVNSGSDSSTPNTSTGDNSENATTDVLGGIFSGSIANTILSGVSGALDNIANSAAGKVTSILGSIFGDTDTETDGTTETSNTNSSSATSVTAPSAHGLDGSANDIWKYLTKDVGMSKIAAAGMMGCWSSESSNKPKRVEADWLDGFPGYDEIGDSADARNKWTTDVIFKKTRSINKSGYLGPDGNYYPGVGIAQWTGSRGKSLLDYAKKNNVKWYTFDAQFPFAVSEMQSRGLIDKMNSATTVNDATRQFLDGYEMYSGWSNTTKGKQQLADRQAAANQIYNQLKDVDVSDSDDTGETGAGKGFLNRWGRGNMLTMLGSKSKKAIFPEKSFGTGADANVSALNSQVRRINNLIANTRDEVVSDPVTNAVNQIQKTIADTKGTTSNDESIKILAMIAQSMTTMVQLLTDIKSNTTPTEPGVSSGQPGDNNNKYSNLPVAENEPTAGNYNDRSYATGKSIIDKLTSK